MFCIAQIRAHRVLRAATRIPSGNASQARQHARAHSAPGVFLPEEQLEQLQRPNMGYNPPPHGQAPGPRNPMLSRHVPDSGHLRPRASFAGAASFLRVRNRSIQYATDTCLSPSDKAGPILFAHFFEVAQPLCITLPNLVHPPAFGSHVWSGSHPCSLQMPIRYERAAHTCLQDLFPLKDLF